MFKQLAIYSVVFFFIFSATLFSANLLGVDPFSNFLGQSTQVSASPAVDGAGIPLKISASEKTWLRVTIDENKPKDYLLQTGDHLDLEAKTRYHLHIGNAGGIQLELNHKPYPFEVKPGGVVKLNI